MSESVQPIAVAGGLLWRGDRFLAARRPHRSPQAGLWEFPGGKIEPGESPEEALVRELEEELGVIVHAPKLWTVVEHQYPRRTVRLHVFHVEVFSGEPFPREGQILRWVTPREAETLPFLPADRPLVTELSVAGKTAPCAAFFAENLDKTRGSG